MRHFSRLSVGALAASVGLVVGVKGVQAAPVIYTNRAAWAAAAGGLIQTEGFESLPVGALPLGTSQLGLITLTVTSLTGATASQASIASTPAMTGTRNLSLNADEESRTYVLSFGGQSLRAFGADYLNANTGGGLTLLVNGVTLDVGGTLANGSGFFGFVDTDTFTSFGYGDRSPVVLPTEIFNTDQNSFVVAAASEVVPEVGTCALLAGGLLPLLAGGLLPLLAGAVRRRRLR